MASEWKVNLIVTVSADSYEKAEAAAITLVPADARPEASVVMEVARCATCNTEVAGCFGHTFCTKCCKHPREHVIYVMGADTCSQCGTTR